MAKRNTMKMCIIWTTKSFQYLRLKYFSTAVESCRYLRFEYFSTEKEVGELFIYEINKCYLFVITSFLVS